MNKHLDKYLCDKYPKIFVERNLSPQETCMCWGFPGDGWFFILDTLCYRIQHHIDNPPWVEKSDLLTKAKKVWNKTAWNCVIYPLAHLIVRSEKPTKRQWKIYNWISKWGSFNIYFKKPKNPIPQLVATQVKEKFGTLRFYYSGGDKYTKALVDYAEELSCFVCEDCGRMDETISRNSGGWIRTTCDKCTKPKDSEDHKENRNQELVEVWDKAKKEKLESNLKILGM